jgi:acyl dehydratase
MLPGKFYEEIQIGDERLTPRVTVTEGHVLAYAGVAGDFSPIHMDEIYAQSTVFGGRIAHGLMGLSLTDGMKVQSGFFHDGIALGWTCNYTRPIRIGDTLQVKFRIADMRIPRSRSDMGILTIAIELLNQHGEVVQEGEHRLMVPRKPDAAPAEAI